VQAQDDLHGLPAAGGQGQHEAGKRRLAQDKGAQVAGGSVLGQHVLGVDPDFQLVDEQVVQLQVVACARVAVQAKADPPAAFAVAQGGATTEQATLAGQQRADAAYVVGGVRVFQHLQLAHRVALQRVAQAQVENRQLGTGNAGQQEVQQKEWQCAKTQQHAGSLCGTRRPDRRCEFSLVRCADCCRTLLPSMLLRSNTDFPD